MRLQNPIKIDQSKNNGEKVCACVCAVIPNDIGSYLTNFYKPPFIKGG